MTSIDKTVKGMISTLIRYGRKTTTLTDIDQGITITIQERTTDQNEPRTYYQGGTADLNISFDPANVYDPTRDSSGS